MTTVTITRDGERFVVTLHATDGGDPMCHRTDDALEALEAIDAFIRPGMKVIEIREDPDGTRWQRVNR